MGQLILEVEHLKKSYVFFVPILDDVSFSDVEKVPTCDVSTAWKRLTPVY